MPQHSSKTREATLLEGCASNLLFDKCPSRRISIVKLAIDFHNGYRKRKAMVKVVLGLFPRHRTRFCRVFGRPWKIRAFLDFLLVFCPWLLSVRVVAVQGR